MQWAGKFDMNKEYETGIKNKQRIKEDEILSKVIKIIL